MTWLKLRGPVRFPRSRFEMEDGWLDAVLSSHWPLTLNSRLWLAELWWRVHERLGWLARVSYSWFYSLSRYPTLGLDTRVSCSPIGQLSISYSLIGWVMVSRSKAQQHVITPHKRRGPIAAEFSTPGPASVKLPGLFGSKHLKIFQGFFSLIALLILSCHLK